MVVRSFKTLVLGLAAAGLSVAPAFAAAPTADDLVARNLAARGGAPAVAALQSVRFTGKLIFSGGFELSYVETRDRKAGDRFDATIQGLTLIQAYDGKGGWKINPFQGRKDAERMSDDEARQLADGATIEGPLLLAGAEGATVTALGVEDVDGSPAYKLKVVQKDGDEFTYFLDPDTWLEIKIVERRKIRGAEQVTVTDLGDYEKVGGVYFPMSLVAGPQGAPEDQRQITAIDKGEANVTVSAGYFNMPAAPAAKSK